MTLKDKIHEAERHLNRASLSLVEAKKLIESGCRTSAEGCLADANKYMKAAQIFAVRT